MPTALTTHTKCEFPAGETPSREHPEDCGVNRHLSAQGWSRGKLLPHPPGTGATGNLPSLLHEDSCQPCWVSRLFPSLMKRVENSSYMGDPGRGRQPHTAVRPSLFLYDEMTVIIPHVSAEHL